MTAADLALTGAHPEYSRPNQARRTRPGLGSHKGGGPGVSSWRVEIFQLFPIEEFLSDFFSYTSTLGGILLWVGVP